MKSTLTLFPRRVQSAQLPEAPNDTRRYTLPTDIGCPAWEAEVKS